MLLLAGPFLRLLLCLLRLRLRHAGGLVLLTRVKSPLLVLFLRLFARATGLLLLRAEEVFHQLLLNRVTKVLSDRAIELPAEEMRSGLVQMN